LVIRSQIYFLLWSLMVVIAPLLALLYGAVVRDGRAVRGASPYVPATYAPPITPERPPLK
jgi:hypothetical protein